MDVMDGSWEDLKVAQSTGKAGVGLLLQTTLCVSRTPWYYWIIWKSYEIFSTSDFYFSRTGLEKNVLGCFRMLSFLD